MFPGLFSVYWLLIENDNEYRRRNELPMKRLPRQSNGFREVAKLAGVSAATVSRVANRNADVARATQARVMDAARSLGIKLEGKNKPKAVAFLLSNREVLHPFHAHVLVGANTACAACGWDMLFLMFQYRATVPWKELHLPTPLQRQDMVAGLIVAGNNSPNLLDCLQYRDIPFVALANNIVSDGKQRQFDAVYSDDRQGVYEMTRYLHSLRHRNIGFVGNTAEPWCQRTLQGYKRAMDEMGLPCRVSHVDSSDAEQVGYLGTKLIFGQAEKPTALLAPTDQTAQGIYKAAKDLGLSIPQDLSVAGGNDSAGSTLDPGLTSIRLFPEQLGKKMVELLLRRLDNAELPSQETTIPIELVKRNSCREIPLEVAQAEAVEVATLRPLSSESPQEVGGGGS